MIHPPPDKYHKVCETCCLDDPQRTRAGKADASAKVPVLQVGNSKTATWQGTSASQQHGAHKLSPSRPPGPHGHISLFYKRTSTKNVTICRWQPSCVHCFVLGLPSGSVAVTMLPNAGLSRIWHRPFCCKVLRCSPRLAAKAPLWQSFRLLTRECYFFLVFSIHCCTSLSIWPGGPGPSFCTIPIAKKASTKIFPTCSPSSNSSVFSRWSSSAMFFELAYYHRHPHPLTTSALGRPQTTD